VPISGVRLLSWFRREPLGVGASRTVATALADTWTEHGDKGFHAAPPGLYVLSTRLEPAAMLPQTEAAVLTEPCNFV
jgi:hypothetical protein